ncbi:hypothetical protein B0J11DRAFT_616147 [Dendryphion nanum]|uniref:Geranylgeranyl pyrophosphate synthetase n=1 Tax=Dendryphion nanum TaxID=256645 RepID=A0A9P9DNK4_9PLEO|nr:hypothetical protein B0J11DRAFT_616147 [Dendryphion nanum]
MLTNTSHTGEFGWGSSYGSASSGRPRRGRAGYSNRGRYADRGGSRHKLRPDNVPNVTLHPLGDLIATIDNAALDQALITGIGAPRITDCQYIASYNWLNEKEPTISVPGKPPLWTPLNIPRRLKADSGNYFRDPNAARFPRYPTEPAVRTLLQAEPEFSLSSVDVFACGSTMGSLLRFVRRIDKPFRFVVEVVNKTVFFVRTENSPDEVIEGVKGYGHTFPENYTTWENEVKGSQTHQRMIRYQFGGFHYIVRFECDGYLKDGNSPLTKPSNDGDITTLLEASTISQQSSTKDDLTIKKSGSMVPQDSVFDLKTRSGRFNKQIDMDEQIPTLWVKQIPNFIAAYHDGAGLFERNNIQVRNVKKEIQEWETENEAALKRLAALVRKIVDFAQANSEHRIDVYSPSTDCLKIHKKVDGASRVLPPSLRAKWESVDSCDKDRDHDHPNEDNHRKAPYLSDSESDTGYGENGVELDEYHGEDFNFNIDGDDQGEPDYTGCLEHVCGYCGRCTY